ncbi:hypothetical protein [Acinetobacter sp. WU_MDCI_Abxb74]|uniref:hypothetical protein n=1 Tax=Acinetobacter sp. WU_MDCI_Abxb74 TaxID=2850072 RepID=UPI0021CDE725|nr:hypothetical protein [Acinetobacter sp. WU_MDCI_Abxb74]
MHSGHFLRHSRRTKRTYSARRDELIKCLKQFNLQTYTAGLSVLINLLPSLVDQKNTNEALAINLAPAPLSLWYQNPKNTVSDLMLGMAFFEKESASNFYHLNSAFLLFLIILFIPNGLQ